MSFKIRFPIAHLPTAYIPKNKQPEVNLKNKQPEVNNQELNQKIIDGDKNSDIKINSIINSTTVINCSSDIDREKIINKLKNPSKFSSDSNLFFNNDTEQLIKLKELDPMFFDIEKDIKYYDNANDSTPSYDLCEINNLKNIEDIFNKIINIEDDSFTLDHTPGIDSQNNTHKSSPYTPSLSHALSPPPIYDNFNSAVQSSSECNNIFFPNSLRDNNMHDNNNSFFSTKTSDVNLGIKSTANKSLDMSRENFFSSTITDKIYIPTVISQPVHLELDSYLTSENTFLESISITQTSEVDKVTKSDVIEVTKSYIDLPDELQSNSQLCDDIMKCVEGWAPAPVVCGTEPDSLAGEPKKIFISSIEDEIDLFRFSCANPNIPRKQGGNSTERKKKKKRGGSKKKN